MRFQSSKVDYFNSSIVGNLVLIKERCIISTIQLKEIRKDLIFLKLKIVGFQLFIKRAMGDSVLIKTNYIISAIC